jgi:hypothetical protein
MATWQADFELRPDSAPLPPDFRARLDALLPRGRSWHERLEVWGEEDGHRIDVWPESDGSGEARLRVDMRALDVAWAERTLDVVHGLGRELWTLWTTGGQRLSDPGELALALRGSPAWRFVEDPQAFLRRVQLGSHEDA